MSQPSYQAMNQMMNQFMYDILNCLCQTYATDTKKFVYDNDLFMYLYNGYRNMGFLLNRSQFDAAIEVLKSMNFIEVESAYYRVKPQGYAQFLNPPPNYAELSLAAQEQSNRLAQDSNRISKESNQVAEKANKLANEANRIAYWSIGIAILSIIISIIAIFVR